MSTISLNFQKIELARQILNENNEDVIQKVMQYFKKVKNVEPAHPCQMTIEELKKEIEQSVLQYERGETKTHEEFFSELRTW